MKYAVRYEDGRWALGALDLIEDPESILPIDLNTITTQRVRGSAPIADVTQTRISAQRDGHHCG